MATQAVLHVVAASLAPVFDGADLSAAPFDVAVDTAEQRGLLIPACGLIRLSAAVSVYFASIDSAMAYAAGLLAAYREVIATADDDFDGLVRTKFRPMRLVVDSGHSSVEQTVTPRAGIRVTGPLGERPNAYLEAVPDNLLIISHHARRHVDDPALVRPIGEVRLGRFQGPLQMFHVPLRADPEPPASGSVAPTIRNLHFFRDTEEMLSFIGRESARRKSTGQFAKDVRYMSFNGAATLNDYLNAVRAGLGEDYSIRFCCGTTSVRICLRMKAPESSLTRFADLTGICDCRVISGQHSRILTSPKLFANTSSCVKGLERSRFPCGVMYIFGFRVFAGLSRKESAWSHIRCRVAVLGARSDQYC